MNFAQIAPGEQAKPATETLYKKHALRSQRTQQTSRRKTTSLNNLKNTKRKRLGPPPPLPPPHKYTSKFEPQSVTGHRNRSAEMETVKPARKS